MKRENNTMRSLSLALLAIGMLIPCESMAFLFGNDWLTGDPNAYLPQHMYKKGAVYTRQVVLGPNGLPQYVGYDVDGSEAAYYGELQGAKVFSAAYYNALLSQLNQIKSQYPELELLDRNSYSARVFSTVDGKSITAPALGQDSVMVAVKPASQLFTVDTNPVLMESPVDLTFGPLDADIKSLLLNEDGTVNTVSPYNIGPRVAYYGDPDAAQGSGVYNPGSAKRKTGDTIFGPLPGIRVEVGADNWVGVTDNEGRYHINYTVPACPGFTIMYPNWIFVTMNYHRFNPKGLADHPRPLYWENQDFCNGMAAFGAGVDIVNSSAVTIEPIRDFPIDLSVVNGRALMTDGVVVNSGDTTYDSSRADLSRVIQDRYNNYDFDRDGIPDKVVLGRSFDSTLSDGTTIKLFEVMAATDNPPEMGVWFSSLHDLALITTVPGELHGAPDLSRLTDWSADFEDRALLTQLNADDLLDTDLYIFRESDGSLLMERRGLQEQELRDARIGVAEGGTAFEYTLRFLSRPNSTMKAGMSGATNADEFTTFQVREGVLNEALHQRDADQLRPGEQLRIVAINRPTGYIGSTTATLSGASTYGSNVNVDIQSDDIILAPPNLRVWAERSYEVDKGYTGSTAQQQNIQQHLVGSEGAGLTNDIFINLYTEWLDANNHPLPAALGEYGYTGRMAILTEGNQLKTFGNDYLANFAIKPGRQLQVIQLPGGVEANQHFYIHVTGTPHNRDPKFTATEKGSGILQFRPDKFVPLRVPVYDEAATDMQMDAWHKARAAGNTGLEKPEPFYQWIYRPEFQFTRYDLTVNELRRTDVTGRSEDLLPMEIPVVAGNDQMLDLFYEIFGPLQSDNSLLQALQSYSYNGNQELVFALGEYEILAHMDGSGNVVFDNLAEIFASLNADDLLTLLEEKTLTMRLYANNDPGNVLWEFGIDPGVNVYYRLPHEQRRVKKAKGSPDDNKIYHTLGGVRLRFYYEALSKENVKSYLWQIVPTEAAVAAMGNKALPGRVMKDYTSDIPDLVANGHTIYWEPGDWTYYGNDDVIDFEGKVIITMLDGTTVTEKFRIDRRVLKPDWDMPMEGSDVAMLEDMLWQLGLSPQMGSPGGMGARIGSVRKKDANGIDVMTTNCKGETVKEDKRNVFHPGYPSCQKDSVSTELMLRRFQGRNDTDPDQIVTDAVLSYQSGQIDFKTLTDLGRDWDLYMSAFNGLTPLNGVPPTIIDQTDSRMNAWLDLAVSIWDTGAGTHVPAAEYTEQFHADILKLAGITQVTTDVKDRRALLRNWMISEMPYHWGTNGAKSNGKPYQPTPYRMAEGYSDEHGSLSFSQLLYGKRFGAYPCTVHDELGLNLYDPLDNIKSFTVHAAADATGAKACEGGLHRAFVRAEDDARRLGRAYNVAGAPKGTPGRSSDGTIVTNDINDLVGFKHGSAGAFHAIDLATAQDSYERLAAAVAYYNSGTNLVGQTRRSWPYILKYMKNTAGSTRNTGSVYHSGRYSIAVRSAIFDTNLRTYIWKGGTGVDVNKDGTIADVPADPAATPPKPAIVEVTVPWCFAYGEKEWVSGKAFTKVYEAARGDLLAEPSITPVGRLDCTTGVSIP